MRQRGRPRKNTYNQVEKRVDKMENLNTEYPKGVTPLPVTAAQNQTQQHQRQLKKFTREELDAIAAKDDFLPVLNKSVLSMPTDGSIDHGYWEYKHMNSSDEEFPKSDHDLINNANTGGWVYHVLKNGEYWTQYRGRSLDDSSKGMAEKYWLMCRPKYLGDQKRQKAAMLAHENYLRHMPGHKASQPKPASFGGESTYGTFNTY